LGHKWTQKKTLGKSALNKPSRFSYIPPEEKPQRRKYVKLGKQKYYLQSNQIIWRDDSPPWHSVNSPRNFENMKWWNKFIRKHGDQLEGKIYIGEKIDDWAISIILKNMADNKISINALNPEISKEKLHKIARGIESLGL
jgi:hypothetical protein